MDAGHANEPPGWVEDPNIEMLILYLEATRPSARVGPRHGRSLQWFQRVDETRTSGATRSARRALSPFS